MCKKYARTKARLGDVRPGRPVARECGEASGTVGECATDHTGTDHSRETLVCRTESSPGCPHSPASEQCVPRTYTQHHQTTTILRRPQPQPPFQRLAHHKRQAHLACHARAADRASAAPARYWRQALVLGHQAFLGVSSPARRRTWRCTRRKPGCAVHAPSPVRRTCRLAPPPRLSAAVAAVAGAGAGAGA